MTQPDAFQRDLAALLDKYQRESLFRKAPPLGPVEESEQRLREGRYLMRPCGIEYRSDVCGSYALDLLELLSGYFSGAAPELKKIEECFVSGRADFLKFLEYAFSNQDGDVRRTIEDLNLPPEWTVIFAIYFARPFRASAARMLTKGVDLSLWKQGYCPVCGHWPSLSLRGASERHLWCMQCGTLWKHDAATCPFCGDHDGRMVEIPASRDVSFLRVQGCLRCRRYVKEVECDDDGEDIPCDHVNFGSVDLDELAQLSGFRKESPLVTRYTDAEGNELLMYRQERSSCTGRTGAAEH